MGQREVKAGIKSVLETVDKIGIVDLNAGGVATWVKRPRPLQSYWFVTIRGVEEETFNAKRTRAHQDFDVTIEGWMPMSYELRSSEAWDERVDSVTDALRFVFTLNGIVTECGQPQIETSDFESVSGGENSPVVVCHHVLVSKRVGLDVAFDREQTVNETSG